jgi:2,5-diketo-D-gluconate reductase B
MMVTRSCSAVLMVPNGGKRLRAGVRRSAAGHSRRDDTKRVISARPNHPKAGHNVVGERGVARWSMPGARSGRCRASGSCAGELGSANQAAWGWRVLVDLSAALGVRLKEVMVESLQTQGISIPRIGLGTFRMQGETCRAAVESGLALGYRHLDTAEMYGNEAAVGAAIAACGLPRRDLHVTTKVWPENLAPDAIRRSFDNSLLRLRLDYVDLYMVHWPAKSMNLAAIFETFGRLQEEGRTRAIGVCNFTVPLLRTVIETIRAPIACNQIEYHVLLDQTPVRSYLKGKSVPITAYSPLAQGSLAKHPDLIAIGSKHGASAAQVALKWLLDQEGVMAIPKAQRPETQKANLDALRLTLDEEDRRAIAALPKNRRFVNPAFAPTWDPAPA